MKLLKSIKKQLINKDIKIVFLMFLICKIGLFSVLFLALNFFPLASHSFLGGGYNNYSYNPYVFAWANFDGEHYLSIALNGYRDLELAFFPVYPLLMILIASVIGFNQFNLVISGLIISNLSFLVALLLLYKLILLDYSRQIALLTITLILIFPTSFYFGSLYNESLFLLLSISSFYYLRKNKFIKSALLGALSSGTRVFGLILLPSYLIEVWQQKLPINKFFWIFLIPIGLLTYMLYQWISAGDPLAFYNLQKIVGEQHQEGVTLLPQVYWRYIKMLFDIDPSNPIFTTILLEFLVGILFFILPIYGFFKKVRLSYLCFAMISFLLPTIQGSFSSVPRYVLILFPSFLCLALIIQGFSKWTKIILFLAAVVWFGIETTLFLRGYWVA